MLSQAEKGGVQNTIQNCVTVLQNDPILADSIRLNLLSERIDIVKPMGWQQCELLQTPVFRCTGHIFPFGAECTSYRCRSV